MERTVLITGIRRIGREVALDLLKNGWNVAVVYKNSQKAVEDLGRFAKELGRRLLPVEGDLSNPSTYARVVDTAYGELGRLDAFIHLASPYEKMAPEEVRPEDFDKNMRVIAQSFFFLSVVSRRYMLLNEGEVKGRIIAFGDWAVENTPYRGYPQYFIAKGALHTAVRVLAKEFAPDILVNCIAPGPVLRPEEIDEEKWKGLLSRTPLKREVPLSDVVDATRLLLRTSSITGEILKVDSGRHIAGSGMSGVEG